MIPLSCSPPFRAFGARWFPPSDHFAIHGDGPESELTSRYFVCDVFLFFCHFPIRCSGSGVGLILSIPDICLLPYFYTHTSTDLQEIPYTMLSSQIKIGWLPIRCAYFILFMNMQMRWFSYRTTWWQNSSYLISDDNKTGNYGGLVMFLGWNLFIIVFFLWFYFILRLSLICKLDGL